MTQKKSTPFSGLAVAAGTGLAFGLGLVCLAPGQLRRKAIPASAPSRDHAFLPEPIAVRLDRIEARLGAVESRPAAEAAQKEDPATLQSMLDTTLNLRAEDIRVRLQAEMLESVEASLAGFERTIDNTIDNKVSSRVSPIEKSLKDQSATIADLSRREIASDAHLQRLISAVERLCAQADALSAAPARTRQPSFLDLPFESHLAQ
jgi:hypothetical protein